MVFLFTFLFYSVYSQWQVINSIVTGNLVDGCFLNDSIGFIVSSDGVMLKTVDQGNTWSVNATLSGTFTSICNVGTDTIYIGGNCIYRSVDQGSSWNLVKNLSYTITDLGFFRSQKGFYIVPGYDYCDWAGNTYTLPNFTVYRTIDYGVTWQSLFSNIEETSRFQFINDSVAFIPGGYCFNYPHCCNGYMTASKRTTDKGVTWSTIETMGAHSFFSFIDQDTGYFVLPYDEFHIYKTNDGGNTLTASYTEIYGNTLKQCKFINQIDGYILADNKIYITQSCGFGWNTDFTSQYPLNFLFENPIDYLFCIGDNGTILKKKIIESGYPDSIYRIRLSDNALNFGSIAVNNSSIKSLTVTNTGNFSLDLSISSSDIFKIGFSQYDFTTNLSVSLNPFQDTILYVKFMPQQEQDYFDSIFIISDSLETVTIPVEGNGIYVLTGNISKDTVFCTDILRIGSDIIVNPGVKVTICPGTNVKMMGNYRITVRGVLEALGDSLNPVKFTINDMWELWNGISLEQSDSNVYSIFTYCNFMADCNDHSLYLQNSKAMVDHCNFSNKTSELSGIFGDGPFSILSIRNSNIYDCGGAGIYCNEIDSCSVINCNIYNNRTGITIYNEYASTSYSSAYISDNRIYDNEYGAIYGNRRVRILGNKIYNNGGGINLLFGRPPILIENNEIYNNTGIGIDLGFYEGDAYIIQNLVYNNSSLYNYGAGVLLADNYNTDVTYLLNNTICNNKITEGIGQDFYAFNYCQLRNNIIFNISDSMNSTGWYNAVSPDVDFNCFSQKGLSSIGSNNIFSYPEFTNPTWFAGAITGGNMENRDWSLTRLSPCINAGDTTLSAFLMQNDFAGLPRVYHDRIDMGAYEYQGPIGIREVNGLYTVYVFPNPAKEMLNIIVNNNKPLEIYLYDIFARKIFYKNFINMTSINMQPFARGIYFYEIIDQNVTIRKGKVVRE